MNWSMGECDNNDIYSIKYWGYFQKFTSVGKILKINLMHKNILGNLYLAGRGKK